MNLFSLKLHRLTYIGFSFFCIILFNLNLASSPHWLIEFDCENELSFFEIRTLNTYNLNNCSPENNQCGEYINLMHYSIFHENKVYSDFCNIGGRELKYSLKPINMTGSIYDLTPHFILNLTIDNRTVIQDLPLFPSPLYDQVFWGLKISSIRFNNRSGSIEIIVSDDELYQHRNINKMDFLVNWLWDSNYMSAFDPDWGSKWTPIRENDVWNGNNFYED
tara:strand:- start:1218 stop:1877 length:660 start_codon:yes stop_codon:yes gene_type:complete